MVAAWPSSVPQDALISAFQESWDENVVETKPEHGPPLRRRRSSAGTDSLAIAQHMTAVQITAFEAFYKDDLKSGSLPFTRLHPRKGTTIYCLIGNKPEIAAVRTDLFRVSFPLMVLS